VLSKAHPPTPRRSKKTTERPCGCFTTRRVFCFWACLRLQARQRWPRHARDPGVSRASQYSKYDALYRLGAAAVQRIFSGLIRAACRSSAACSCASSIISIDLARETALTICPDNSRERISGRCQQGPFPRPRPIRRSGQESRFGCVAVSIRTDGHAM
jgi:hypothetical protein